MIRNWQLFLLASVPLSLVLSIAGCSPSGSSEDASAFESQRVTTSAQANLPLFPLGGDIMMPFPRQPELVASLNQGQAQVFHYSWGQEGQPLAYSAMTMAGPAFSEGVDIDRLLQAVGETTLEGMRAAGAVVSVTKNDPIKVGAMQGRVVVADLATRDGASRSHTVNLYHDRRVFQWAIQDAPSVTGSLAVETFFRELNEIRMVDERFDPQSGGTIAPLSDRNDTPVTLSAEKDSWSNQSPAVTYALERWAQAGDAYAQYRLGRRFMDGHGVVQDYTRGICWLRLSAGQHKSDAMLQIAKAYERGLGVEQSLVQAHAWYNVAAMGRGGSSYAASNRERLNQLLSAEEILEAQSLARALAGPPEEQPDWWNRLFIALPEFTIPDDPPLPPTEKQAMYSCD